MTAAHPEWCVGEDRYRHFDLDGSCACSCSDCTKREGDDMWCICPDCDLDACGAFHLKPAMTQ